MQFLNSLLTNKPAARGKPQLVSIRKDDFEKNFYKEMPSNCQPITYLRTIQGSRISHHSKTKVPHRPVYEHNSKGHREQHQRLLKTPAAYKKEKDKKEG